MPKEFKLTPSHIDIIDCRGRGFSLRRIAKRHNCSEANIAKKIKALRKEGYLNRDNFPKPLGYEVVRISKGEKVITLENFSHPVDDKVIIPDNETGRLHAFHLKVPLRTPLSLDQRMKLFDISDMQLIEKNTRKLRNHEDVKLITADATIFITDHNCIVSGFQTELPLSISAYELLIEAWNKALNFVRQFEKKATKAQPSFALMKDDRDVFSMEIIRLEIAHTHHVVAKQILRDGDRFMMKNPDDGLPRIIVDNSKKNEEFEFVHKQHAVEDYERDRQYTQALGGPELRKKWAEDFFINGKLNPWKDREDIEKVIEIARHNAITSSNIVKQQELENEFFRKHNALIEEMRILISKIEKGGGVH